MSSFVLERRRRVFHSSSCRPRDEKTFLAFLEDRPPPSLKKDQKVAVVGYQRPFQMLGKKRREKLGASALAGCVSARTFNPRFASSNGKYPKFPSLKEKTVRDVFIIKRKR